MTAIAIDEVPAVPLPAGVVLMDGGMGQELRRRGLTGGPPGLWSANALLQSPATVLEVHRDYIRAGARIITTNTYSTKRPRLDDAGVGDRFEALNRLAGELACQARDEQGGDVLIAGSLAPLYGSYRPDLVRPFAETLPLYREQAELLAPYVDLFLCETMSCAAEARAAACGAASTGKPVWVAWTLDDRGDRPPAQRRERERSRGRARRRAGQRLSRQLLRAGEHHRGHARARQRSGPGPAAATPTALPRCRRAGVRPTGSRRWACARIWVPIPT